MGYKVKGNEMKPITQDVLEALSLSLLNKSAPYMQLRVEQFLKLHDIPFEEDKINCEVLKGKGE